MRPLQPWFAGFNGSIDPGASAASAGSRDDFEGDLEGEIGALGQLWEERFMLSGGGGGGGGDGGGDGGGGGRAAERFISRGVMNWTDDGLEVTELPIGKWTSSYKAWLLAQVSAAPLRPRRDLGPAGVTQMAAGDAM